jgi:hypothetical protein
VTYKPVILSDGLDRSVAELVPEVGAAIGADGQWTRFFELRMGAGPTVLIKRLDAETDGFQVTVEWGTQKSETHSRGLEMAIEAADRMALVFYDVRNKYTSS